MGMTAEILDLTKAQIISLREAKRQGFVAAHMQRRRSVERLAAKGLLVKSGLVTYRLTAEGREALRNL